MPWLLALPPLLCGAAACCLLLLPAGCFLSCPGAAGSGTGGTPLACLPFLALLPQPALARSSQSPADSCAPPMVPSVDDALDESPTEDALEEERDSGLAAFPAPPPGVSPGTCALPGLCLGLDAALPSLLSPFLSLPLRPPPPPEARAAAACLAASASVPSSSQMRPGVLRKPRLPQNTFLPLPAMRKPSPRLTRASNPLTTTPWILLPVALQPGPVLM
mmetsp:Transcript_22961/g.58687  ORF Transcript_22961/g.58687 Transcript_22961/m.58687 type:complete len:219 (-) Transcript_22961:1302-1958(-)